MLVRICLKMVQWSFLVQIGYDLNVDAIQLQESFLGADVENYRSQLNGKIIEGLTSGVKAKVLFSISCF